MTTIYAYRKTTTGEAATKIEVSPANNVTGWIATYEINGYKTEASGTTVVQSQTTSDEEEPGMIRLGLTLTGFDFITAAEYKEKKAAILHEIQNIKAA